MTDNTKTALIALLALACIVAGITLGVFLRTAHDAEPFVTITGKDFTYYGSAQEFADDFCKELGGVK